MTLDELTKVIAARLGNLRGQDATIKIFIWDAVAELEDLAFTPWFLLSENNHYKTSEDERRVPIPLKFIKEYEEGALYLETKEGKQIILEKKSQDELRPLNLAVGQPLYYALTNKYFRLFPQPDDVYRLELLFYERTTGNKTDSNKWLIEASDVLKWKVLFEMALSRGRRDANIFQGKFYEAYRNLQTKHEERMEANRELIYGGDT